MRVFDLSFPLALQVLRGNVCAKRKSNLDRTTRINTRTERRTYTWALLLSYEY